MIIDLSKLKNVPAPYQHAFELGDLPRPAIEFTGSFEGSVSLAGQDRIFEVNGRFVDRIRLDRAGCTLTLKLPTPVPGHLGVVSLQLKLRHDPGTTAWIAEMLGGGWFKKLDQIKGAVGNWMSQLSPSIEVRLERTGLPGGFPLERTGVCEAIAWTHGAWHHMFMGVFVDAGNEAHMVLVPSAQSGPNATASRGLRLAGLQQAAFGMNSDYIATPMFLALSLSSEARTWRAAVQWDPFRVGNPTSTNRLRARPVIEQAWNLAVQHAMAGAKVQRSAQPVTMLPWLSVSDAMAEAVRPVLVFDLVHPATTRGAARAQLRHVHFGHDDTISLRAEFGWQPAGTAGATWTSQQPWPLHEDALVFEGLLDAQSAVRWRGQPAVGDEEAWAGRITETFKSLDSKATPLGRWHAKGLVSRKHGGHDEWLVWGSLEFRLPPGTQAELECRLSGEWRESHADIYPETVLTIRNCEVRTSATTDVAGRDLDAAFGVQDTEEDALQRDSDPLRFPRQARSGGRLCELRLAQRTQPGRNAVTRLEVRSDVNTALGEQGVFLQMRPFFVGVVQPAELDAEAGRLIATWASNDPEGAQWRVPDATVAVTFQPQAVGEAMERGVRFWRAGANPAPWLNPAAALAYRFSPPTQIVVRPSIRDRRYNKSPSNLGAVFADAKVESFTTEMVYPVEARFEVSQQGLPDVRVTETAALLGRPPENLEPLPDASVASDGLLDRWLRLAYSGDASGYASNKGPSIIQTLETLRDGHSAARSSFSARLAQFHLYNPWSAYGGLRLREGIQFRIRDRMSGAPALANPLPQWQKPPGATPTLLATDLTAAQKLEINDANRKAQFLSDTGDWGSLPESIPAGVIHTMEFASELVAVLRNPVAFSGEIESLALSALGASGRMSVSFDEGRTTFIAETSFGQLARLIKVRIGRVGVLWNKAKHVVVYERTTVAAKQFEDEQQYGEAANGAAKDSRGWPVPRKTEEYVEPLEPVRYFASEEQKDVNRAGFLLAGEVVTPRIYVNGAWGRDLEHGYEIPLWNPDDRTGFYPKPFIALQARAAGEHMSRCWHDEPHELVFYTNTERGAGDDPDKWKAKAGVDCPAVLARLPLLSDDEFDAPTTLARPSMPAPRPGAARRPRFDMAVRSDGKVDLQHGRGETHMLAALDIVSVARTAAESPAERGKFSADALNSLRQLEAANAAGARLQSAAALASQAEAMIARATEQLLRAEGDCATIKGGMIANITALFATARTELRKGVDRASILAPISTDAMPFTKALDELQAQLLRHEAALRAPFEKIRGDIEALRQAAQQGGQDVRSVALNQVHAGREIAAAVAKAQKEQLAALLDRLLTLPVGQAEQQLTVIVDQLKTSLTAVQGAFAAGPDFAACLAACATARQALRQMVAHPIVGGLARQLDAPAAMLEGFLSDSQVSATWGYVQAGATTAVAQGIALARHLASALAELNSAATQLEAQLDISITHEIDRLLGEALGAITNAATPLDAALAAALAAIDRTAATGQGAAGRGAFEVIAQWRGIVKTLIGTGSVPRTQAALADGDLHTLADAALTLARGLVSAVENTAGNWVQALEDKCIAAVNGIDCAKADEIASKLRQALSAAEAELRTRIVEQAAKIFDEQTRQRLAELEKHATAVAELGNQAGQAIKLVKAIGELPELPTLSFNADRAEYLFDDIKKQIDTSPFAAKLREIDSGLKQLGIAIPARKLLDQIVPDGLKDIDFSKVFRNIGGLDFEGLFKRFKLPALNSEQIKITQGVDKTTRSAWVTTRVRVDFDEQQSLFEFAGLAVTMARIRLRANSDMSVGANGQRSSTTDATLQADWGLQFGGAALARFREVEVHFDGSAFQFDIEPAKVELHPALKFVEEFARRFSPELPPAVEIEKDSRGVPVGARATMITEIKDLPPLGVVSIGPMRIVSGLGLKMNSAGQFIIRASLAVGAKTSPVWVQVGYLGGGMWLEAQAQYEKSIKYSASVGLAIGCTKSLNVASVARGSFALLLFAYAEISNAGGSLRVGFSLTGSARILGIANASVLLLLEAEHSNGSTRGNGVLDVSIEICWCYTLKLRRDVQHQIS